MEMERFDAIVRQAGAPGASRRNAIRGLAGGVLAAVAAGVGFAAEGKGKGKKRGKRKGKGKPKPKPCDDGKPRRPDGSCAPPPTCSAGERRCDDGTCIPLEACCPDAPDPGCEGWETATCCRGERVCALPPATCEWASWLVYDEETCDCACPAGTIPGPGQFEFICCPESHPTHGNNYHCFGGSQPWVCAIGFIPHPTIPDVCCREDVCGPAAADGAGEGGKEARTARDTTRRGSGDRARDRAPAGRGR